MTIQLETARPRAIPRSPQPALVARFRAISVLLVWAVFLFTLLLGGSLKVWQNERFWAKDRAAQAKAAELQARNIAIADEWTQWMSARPRSRIEVEKILVRVGGPPPAITTLGVGAVKAVSYQHPKNRMHVVVDYDARGMVQGVSETLVFDDDSLLSMSRGRFTRAGELTRLDLGLILSVDWIGLVLLFFLLRPWRWGISQLLLGTALLAGVTWATSPNVNVSIRGAFSNGALLWPGALIAVSVTLMGLTAPLGAEKQLRQSFFRGQFGLRTLLAATAAIAILLALRPLSVFAASVALLGLLWFYFVLLLRTRRDQVLSAQMNPLEKWVEFEEEK